MRRETPEINPAEPNTERGPYAARYRRGRGGHTASRAGYPPDGEAGEGRQTDS